MTDNIFSRMDGNIYHMSIVPCKAALINEVLPSFMISAMSHSGAMNAAPEVSAQPETTEEPEQSAEPSPTPGVDVTPAPEGETEEDANISGETSED